MTSAVLLRGGIYAESRSAAGVTRTAYAFLGIMCENSDPGNPGPFKDFKAFLASTSRNFTEIQWEEIR